jgi:tRNA pseudouridine38-40 synthase
MARIALGVEYDGSAFSGWQQQPHARSVQDELQRALASVAAQPVTLVAAGRTDAGVHALAQVAHFETTAERPLQAWVLGTNTACAADVSVLWAQAVPDSFHARYSAQARRYVYRLLNQPERPALDRQRVCWVRRPVDAGRMHAAAQCLVGTHDFSSFRAAECQSKSAERRLLEIAVERSDDYIDIGVRANAFLHHMVRNIAGTLLLVGKGDRDVDWVADVLECRDRRRAGPTAPPQGLYFAGVDYPAEFGLPSYKLRRPRSGVPQ